MARKKAKELDANAHHAQPYVKPNMEGRVRHDTLWRRCVDGWKPGKRTWVSFKKKDQ